MSISHLLMDLPDPMPPRQRDARGRFARNNTISSSGGRARARALTPRRRRAIARKGYKALIKCHWGGDQRAQRKYWGEMGAFQYEVQAGALLPDGSRRPGSPLRTSVRHPGDPQDWRSRYYMQDLFTGDHRDVNFYQE